MSFASTLAQMFQFEIIVHKQFKKNYVEFCCAKLSRHQSMGARSAKLYYLLHVEKPPMGISASFVPKTRLRPCSLTKKICSLSNVYLCSIETVIINNIMECENCSNTRS